MDAALASDAVLPLRLLWPDGSGGSCAPASFSGLTAAGSAASVAAAATGATKTSNWSSSLGDVCNDRIVTSFSSSEVVLGADIEVVDSDVVVAGFPASLPDVKG